MKINYEWIIKYNENWSKKIADKHGTTGDKVFGALMDNWKNF